MAKNTGIAVGKFTIAVKGYKKDEPSNFFNCVIFGKQAELMSQTLFKGSPVIINGALKSGKYENSAGVTVYTTDIIVNQFSYEDKQKNAEPEIIPTDDESPF
jgi:single-strand DNA-binding protein